MKKRLIHVISFLFIFLAIVFSTIYYIQKTSGVFYQQAEFALERNAVTKARELDTFFDYASSNIQLISNFTTTQMKQKELKNPNEVFASYAGEELFDLIEYIRWDGINAMNSVHDAEPFDASDRIYYIEGMKGKSGIWPNYKPKIFDGILLNFYTPLYYKGEISGVITGALDSSVKLSSILDTTFFGQTAGVILCDDNNIIVSSTIAENYSGLCLTDYPESEVILDIMDHMQYKRTTAFGYVQNGKKGICAVAPLQKNGWYVILMIYPQTLQACLKDISSQSSIYLILVFIIMAVFLGIYVIASHKGNYISTNGILDIGKDLSLEYENVYVTELDTSRLYIYKLSDLIQTKYGKSFPSGDYEYGIKLYSENEVIPEDRIKFERVSNVRKLKALLTDEDKFHFTYRVKRGGKIHWLRCTFYRADKNSNRVVGTFRFVDDPSEYEK